MSDSFLRQDKVCEGGILGRPTFPTFRDSILSNKDLYGGGIFLRSPFEDNGALIFLAVLTSTWLSSPLKTEPENVAGDSNAAVAGGAGGGGGDDKGVGGGGGGGGRGVTTRAVGLGGRTDTLGARGETTALGDMTDTLLGLTDTLATARGETDGGADFLLTLCCTRGGTLAALGGRTDTPVTLWGVRGGELLPDGASGGAGASMSTPLSSMCLSRPRICSSDHPEPISLSAAEAFQVSTPWIQIKGCLAKASRNKSCSGVGADLRKLLTREKDGGGVEFMLGAS